MTRVSSQCTARHPTGGPRLVAVNCHAEMPGKERGPGSSPKTKSREPHLGVIAKRRLGDEFSPLPWAHLHDRETVGRLPWNRSGSSPSSSCADQ